MAVNYNLEAEQGSDFIFHVKYIDDVNSPVDLSGMTAEMQVRRHVGSSSTLAEWATSAGQSGSTGGIWVIADPTTMSNVPTGQHHYDLELNSSNSTIRLIEGRFEVKGNVTR